MTTQLSYCIHRRGLPRTIYGLYRVQPVSPSLWRATCLPVQSQRTRCNGTARLDGRYLIPYHTVDNAREPGRIVLLPGLQHSQAIVDAMSRTSLLSRRVVKLELKGSVACTFSIRARAIWAGSRPYSGKTDGQSYAHREGIFRMTIGASRCLGETPPISSVRALTLRLICRLAAATPLLPPSFPTSQQPRRGFSFFRFGFNPASSQPSSRPYHEASKTLA
ncbi:hypothetical protein BDW75DRAFT_109040 [Aspergillus navahoensis]